MKFNRMCQSKCPRRPNSKNKLWCGENHGHKPPHQFGRYIWNDGDKIATKITISLSERLVSCG